MRKNINISPDEHTYNTVINGCARQGRYDQGVALLEEMCKCGVAPSNFTLSVLVKLASRSRKVDKAFELCETLAKKYNLTLNIHVYNGLIQACITHRDVWSALSVLQLQMQEHVR